MKDGDLVDVPSEMKDEANEMLEQIEKIFAHRRMGVCQLTIAGLLAKVLVLTPDDGKKAVIETLVDNAFQMIENAKVRVSGGSDAKN